METETTWPNSLNESTITLIPKAQKEVTKKQNYTPISLINIDAKRLIKYWQMKSKDTSEKSSTMIKSALSPEMQGWFNKQKSVNVINHINKLKIKTMRSFL